MSTRNTASVRHKIISCQPLGTHLSVSIPDVEVYWADNPFGGARCYFLPDVQPLAAPCLSQLSGADVTRVFSHLALVHLVRIPPITANPQSCSRQVVVLPSSSGPVWDQNMYQVTEDRWENEALAS